MFSKKKDEKYVKINDNAKLNQDINNTNKENLYQRFSNKEMKNTEKPVMILIYNLFYFLFFLETIDYSNQGILNY